MAEHNWTDDQRNAIEARDGTVIVGAAAGSGKTTVLVERIIQRLLDPINTCDATELLIVTFTRAATAEMRSRLAKAVNKALKEDPSNDRLATQQMLLPSASIYTIDAFCSNLVRENFESIKDYNIPPDFGTIDENESQVLQRQALDEIIEELYADKENKNFRALVDLLSQGDKDKTLEDNILDLYKYSRAYPDPEYWLKKSIKNYDPNAVLNESPVGISIKENALEMLEYAQRRLESAKELLLSDEDLAKSKAIDILVNEANLIIECKNLIADFKFSKCIDLLNSYSFGQWKTTNAKDPLAISAKASRDAVKDILNPKKGLLLGIICESEVDFYEDMQEMQPVVEELINATIKFSNRFLELKLEQGKLDFSDIELFALRLLVENPADSVITRTQLAKDLSNSYKEILIDEYQDTNEMQDMIFRAISKDENNMFMVGDVKQSIYGFRQAMPEIFLKKKSSFKKYDENKPSYPATITLGMNFRSRIGITEYINDVFKIIMKPKCGGLEYNEDEKLVFGATNNYGDKQLDPPEVEFHILRHDKESELKAIEEQARFIANFITEKVKNEPETSYKDFTILMQSVKSKAPIVDKIFKEYAIPVFASIDSGFLDSADIQIIISLLRVIDNPLQDIPLLSVLMSPIFGFSADEIAAMKINNHSGSLYNSLSAWAKNGNVKAEEACKAISLYSSLAVSLPASELIRKIYEDTSFSTICAALPNGNQRVSNLRLLQSMAADYDRTSILGISGFVRYLDRMDENEIDTKPASTISENADVVRIMTIHGSKGLEFKYCIVLNTNNKFNMMDINQKNIILHPTLGVGIKGRNFETGNTYPCLAHKAVQLEKKKNLMAEYIRVLYVALTRAKEKLIIIGSGDDELEKFIEKYAFEFTEDANIPPYVVNKCGSLLDLLMYPTLMHPSAKCLRDASPINIPISPSNCKINVNWHQNILEEIVMSTANTFKEISYDDTFKELVKTIEENIQYEYPYKALANVTTKRAASHLKDGEFSEAFFASTRPEFVSKSGLTPAERGTCLHKFMQYANFENAQKDIDLERERLERLGFLTQKETDAINPKKVLSFFKSDIYQRMKNSPNLMREKKFAVLVPAGRFDPSLPDNQKDEPVLIQGIADCVFEENGNLIIVDYKTDQTKDEEVLINRHKPQLETYVSALTECIGKPVTEAYIYSFSLDKEIKVI